MPMYPTSRDAQIKYMSIADILRSGVENVNFYGNVVNAERSSSSMWKLTITDNTGSINCICHEGEIREGVFKHIPFQRGLLIRVHNAEPFYNLLILKVGKNGCHVVLWDHFSTDASQALFFSAKRFTKNVERDQLMLDNNLKVLSSYVVSKATETSKIFKASVVYDMRALKNMKSGDIFTSAMFYKIDKKRDPEIEYYTKCDCEKSSYLRVSNANFQISCTECSKDLTPGIKKTINIRMKTDDRLNLYFVVELEKIPEHLSHICASKAIVLWNIPNTILYELYIEQVIFR